SRRQLLRVARGGLHDLGADLSAGGVDYRDGISRLVIAYARSIRPLLPIRAIRVALDLPFAMPYGSGRRLVESCAILRPVDHPLAGFPACGCCGGLQIDGLA